jgi:hypothetical protein
MCFVHRLSGCCVGWLDGSDFFSLDGRHLGRLKGAELYSPDARYLGEIRDGRLVIDIHKRTDRLWMSFPDQPTRSMPVNTAPKKASLLVPYGYADFDDLPMPVNVRERAAA